MIALNTQAKIAKIAAIGGFIVAGTGYSLQYAIQKRVRVTTIYKEALSTLYSHPKAAKYLGEPIKEGRVTFGEYEQDTKWFSVVLKASNTNGNLLCTYVTSNDPETSTYIKKLEITFNNIPNKIFVIKSI